MNTGIYREIARYPLVAPVIEVQQHQFKASATQASSQREYMPEGRGGRLGRDCKRTHHHY